MSDQMFELKLVGGKVVRWPGKDGQDAAQRYVDAHRDCRGVFATREDRTPQIRVGIGEGTP